MKATSLSCVLTFDDGSIGLASCGGADDYEQEIIGWQRGEHGLVGDVATVHPASATRVCDRHRGVGVVVQIDVDDELRGAVGTECDAGQVMRP